MGDLYYLKPGFLMAFLIVLYHLSVNSIAFEMQG